jgi:hypothetical protein
MALAPLVSVVVGFVMTFARCLITGGIYGGTWESVRIQWRHFLLLALVDAVGGLLVAFILWAVAPQRVASLTELAKDAPVAFWSIVGVTGPLFVSGVMRLLPARMTTKNSGSLFGDPELTLELVRFRKQLTDLVYEAVEQGADVRIGIRDDWLISTVKNKARIGQLDPEKLMRCLEKAVDRRGKSSTVNLNGKPWTDFRKERAYASNDPLVYVDLVERMAWTAIAVSLQNAVATSCGIILIRDSRTIVRAALTASAGGDDEPTRSDFDDLDNLSHFEGELNDFGDEQDDLTNDPNSPVI